MCISPADQALLASHHVQIDIQDKCGLMTIQGRKYTVKLLSAASEAKDQPTTYQSVELSKEQMRNTASKVAVILLKKELLQSASPNSLTSFKIDEKGIKKTDDSKNEKVFTHGDYQKEKNTRSDYYALMNYLSPSPEETEQEELDSSESGMGAVGKNRGPSKASPKKTGHTEESQESPKVQQSEELKKKKKDLFVKSRKMTHMAQSGNRSSVFDSFKNRYGPDRETSKSNAKAAKSTPVIKQKRIKFHKKNNKVGHQPLAFERRTREKTKTIFLEIQQKHLPQPQSSHEDALSMSPALHTQLDKDRENQDLQLVVYEPHVRSKAEKFSTAGALRPQGHIAISNPLVFRGVPTPLLSKFGPSLFSNIRPEVKEMQDMTRSLWSSHLNPPIHFKPPRVVGGEETALTLYRGKDSESKSEINVLNHWQLTQPGSLESIYHTSSLTRDFCPAIMGSNKDYRYFTFPINSGDLMVRDEVESAIARVEEQKWNSQVQPFNPWTDLQPDTCTNIHYLANATSNYRPANISLNQSHNYLSANASSYLTNGTAFGSTAGAVVILTNVVLQVLAIAKLLKGW